MVWSKSTRWVLEKVDLQKGKKPKTGKREREKAVGDLARDLGFVRFEGNVIGLDE